MNKDLAQYMSYILNPAYIIRDTIGEPYPYQELVLNSKHQRILVLIHRQGAKSTTAATLIKAQTMRYPDTDCLIISPSQRQSDQTLRRIKNIEHKLSYNLPKVSNAVRSIEYKNRSRVIALPGEEDTIRGFTPALLVADEASRIMDDVYAAISPMLAVGKGRFVLLSTAFGKRGYFFKTYEQYATITANTAQNGKSEEWLVINVTADQCPSIDPEFLESERKILGEKLFNQEYMNTFNDPVNAVIPQSTILAALDESIKPLFAGVE